MRTVRREITGNDFKSNYSQIFIIPDNKNILLSKYIIKLIINKRILFLIKLKILKTV